MTALGWRDQRPRTAELDEPLADVQQRWLALPRKQQDELYAAEFAPAFAPLFAELPLHGAPGGFERLQATARMASLLVRLQQFAAQAAVVREGLVTHFDLESGNEPLPEPGSGFPEGHRDEADTRWGDARKICTEGGRGFPPKLLENLKISQLAVNARNDIEHGGLRSNPSDALRLRKTLGDMATKFERLVLSDD